MGPVQAYQNPPSLFTTSLQYKFHGKIQSLFLFASLAELQPFILVNRGLASIFNITNALHAGKYPDFLTAFVPSSTFLSRATPTYTENFAIIVIFNGRKFQNMLW